MMKIKKVMFVLFMALIYPVFAKSYNAIENVNTFRFQVEEDNFVAKNKREIKYEVLIDLPKRFKKTISFPEMNKGEVYLYNKKEKTVYLPIFHQTKTSKLDDDENQVLRVVTSLVKQLKTDANFRKKYYKKEKISFTLDGGYTVILNDYTIVDNYIFPNKWTIEENGIKMMDLNLSEVEISPKFTEKNFQIP